MTERIQKLISAAGLMSRRAAEEAISAGRVAVNGVKAGLGDKADPELDTITVDGKELPKQGEKLYLMLNKPRGYVTTLHDEKGRKNVTELVGELGSRVYPVGRLDMYSEGLLFLTNDGDFAHRVISPKFAVEKRYDARVEGTPDEADIAAFAQGLVLGDGTKCRPARLEITGQGACRVTVTEGKYHQVKRMLASRGKPVTELKRLSIGALFLPEELEEGGVRELAEEDLCRVFMVR